MKLSVVVLLAIAFAVCAATRLRHQTTFAHDILVPLTDPTFKLLDAWLKSERPDLKLNKSTIAEKDSATVPSKWTIIYYPALKRFR